VAILNQSNILMMKKNFFNALLASVMLAATAGLMTACSVDDNPTSCDPSESVIKEKLQLTVGNTKMDMIFVKGGDYSMTINRNGTELKASGTMADFYISQTEVTNKLWKAVMGSLPTEQTQKGDEYPVAYNSYNDVVKKDGFIDKLNEMVKDQLPAGKKLALPTEVEWHYAAMGGNMSKGYKYAGSNTIGNVAWYKDNCNEATHPVGQKQANELGIFDMSGNVWEFTSTIEGDKVINCGGGWTSEANWCEANLSFHDETDERFNNTGVRLVVK